MAEFPKAHNEPEKWVNTTRLAELVRAVNRDPLKLAKVLWPDVRFYNKQRETIYSVWENDETYVPAGHMLGKDFVTGFICLAFFLTRNPCKVITTSVDASQLEGVLWGEIRRFIQTSRLPLEVERGGPLVINHMHIRKRHNGRLDPVSTLIGRVAASGEGLSGHHVAKTGDGIPRALAIIDEASGVDQISFEKMGEWSHRTLVIGNPYDCNNAFRWAVEGTPDRKDLGGDIPREGEAGGYYRKVIQIPAECSPNVDLALRQLKLGTVPTNQIVLPGVLPYEDYIRRRTTWDTVKQTVGLDARFYRGAANLLYPPLWLDLSEHRAIYLRDHSPIRSPKAIGIDPGEGEANTAMVCVDEHGVVDMDTQKTPNTAVITRNAIAFGKKHDVHPSYWIFDKGGGGTQHANILRELGYPVRTVGFGEGLIPDIRRGHTPLQERREQREDRYSYTNRRAQMYGILRTLIDPQSIDTDPITGTTTPRSHPFAIPPWFPELRQQLAPIPLLYDGEGRMYLPPKNRKGSVNARDRMEGTSNKSGQKTMVELIGHSPDEADALVLALWGMLNAPSKTKVGVAW
jgi:hypothetical protein